VVFAGLGEVVAGLEVQRQHLWVGEAVGWIQRPAGAVEHRHHQSGRVLLQGVGLGDVAVDPPRPDRHVIARIVEVEDDAERRAVLAHGAVEDELRTQRPRPLVRVRAAERLGVGCRDHLQLRAVEGALDFVGEPVGEIARLRCVAFDLERRDGEAGGGRLRMPPGQVFARQPEAPARRQHRGQRHRQPSHATHPRPTRAAGL
jgi:hypothetical protein